MKALNKFVVFLVSFFFIFDLHAKNFSAEEIIKKTEDLLKGEVFIFSI